MTYNVFSGTLNPTQSILNQGRMRSSGGSRKHEVQWWIIDRAVTDVILDTVIVHSLSHGLLIKILVLVVVLLYEVVK